ncbi:MAG: protein of unknown function transrane, partial [Rhodospirillales bacterium]|nr:protein of unknown function transrane [Rhodospirillales bacterium]
SYQLSGGDPRYILERPGAIGIILVMVFSLLMTAWSKRRQARAELEEAEAARRLEEEIAAPSDAQPRPR